MARSGGDLVGVLAEDETGDITAAGDGEACDGCFDGESIRRDAGGFQAGVHAPKSYEDDRDGEQAHPHHEDAPQSSRFFVGPSAIRGEQDAKEGGEAREE